MRSQALNRKRAPRSQDAASLAVASDPVWKEHHAELAAHDIEGAVVEWQVESIGLLPGDPLVRRLLAGCYGQHRRIQVGDQIAGICAKQRCKNTGHDAGACRRLENGIGAFHDRTLRNVRCIRSKMSGTRYVS